jgi:uncharacterized membrane protein
MELTRILRHWLTTPRAVRRAFPEPALAAIREAIGKSELSHSGEIRFAVEAALPWSYLTRDAPARERAEMVFSKLRVWDTERNNGVLIYVVLADHQIHIVADRGLRGLVDGEEWNAIAQAMRDRFRSGDFLAGTGAGIKAVGEVLARHFPLEHGARDADELPNEPAVL